MKKKWFKARRFGWGWYPATWQGWIVVLVYAGILTQEVRVMHIHSQSISDTLSGLVIPFLVATAILFIICYITGEEPKWRWGKKD